MCIDKKRLLSVLTAVLLMMIAVLPAMGTAVSAAGDEYTITGYNKVGIIKDKNGDTVNGIAYCLNAKLDTPNGNSYSMTKLSESEYSAEVRTRLQKILDFPDQIRSHSRYLDNRKQKKYLSGVQGSNFSESMYNDRWKHVTDSDSTLQTLVWAVVHEENEWQKFVNDRGESYDGDKEDNYYFNESKLGYHSSDPINDEYSLWNMYYIPMIQYIDSLPASGNDAAFYKSSNSSYQNMLGLLHSQTITKIYISKIDEAGNQLAGAEFKIVDREGKDYTGAVPQSWTSTTAPQEITGLAAGSYVLRETKAPDGYFLPAHDVRFTVSADGKITSAVNAAYSETSIMAKNTKKSVYISKRDALKQSETGYNELSGAKLQILEDDGVTVKHSWTSGEVFEFNDYTVGDYYILRETEAPEGYAKSEDVRFRVSSSGVIERGLGGNSRLNDGNHLVLVNVRNSLYISKKSITGSGELPGAHLMVKDSGGNIVHDWTSSDTPELISGLKINETYTLHEESAPGKEYNAASDTTFVINNNGKVTLTDLSPDKTTSIYLSTSEYVTTITLTNKTAYFISKTDITGENELPGAQLCIYDENNDIFDEWTSSDTPHRITRDLKKNKNYTLREISAPAGFTAATDTVFRIDGYGKLTVTGTSASVNGNTVILKNKANVKLAVSKTDITGSRELAGAHLRILDSTGNVIEEWDSSAEMHTVDTSRLTVGETYTLEETTAPEGFAVAETTSFTISADGKVTAGGSEVTNGIIIVKDKRNRIYVSKYDITGENELEGAHIQLLDNSGNVVTEWDSALTKHEIDITALPAGNYILRETIAPAGYSVAADTPFTLNADGIVTAGGSTVPENHIIIRDSMSTLAVSKVDITTNKEIPGAQIQLLNADGAIVEEWVSSDAPHQITGLKTGERYTLRETVAPAGYSVAADTVFTVSADGKIVADGTVVEGGVILIKDKKNAVYVSKVDIVNNAELPGAHLQVLNSAGNVVEEWDSTSTPHELTNIIAGETYTLRETVAPTGYLIASDTTFSISADGTVTSNGTVTANNVILVKDSRDEKTYTGGIGGGDIIGQNTFYPSSAPAPANYTPAPAYYTPAPTYYAPAPAVPTVTINPAASVTSASPVKPEGTVSDNKPDEVKADEIIASDKPDEDIVGEDISVGSGITDEPVKSSNDTAAAAVIVMISAVLALIARIRRRVK